MHGQSIVSTIEYCFCFSEDRVLLAIADDDLGVDPHACYHPSSNLPATIVPSASNQPPTLSITAMAYEY